MQLMLELWKPKQSWLDLSEEERSAYVESIQPSIGGLMEAGVDLVGIGKIDEDTDRVADYRYWAVWRIPSRALAERFENQVREDGFYDYFEQVNARGEIRDPKDVFSEMIGL